MKKITSKAKSLLRRLNLDCVQKTVSNAKEDCLEAFFSAKTHKVDMPFRLIVSENGTWQKCVALYLQKTLNCLNVNDPFLVKNSCKVQELISSRYNKSLFAFSVDVKDLDYSIPRGPLLHCIEECIDEFGASNFQTQSGISVGGFLELLSFYLRSTYILWDVKPHLQKAGICIGSCIAPIISDLFLAKLDRSVSEAFAHVFRYVDDFLIFIDSDVA